MVSNLYHLKYNVHVSLWFSVSVKHLINKWWSGIVKKSLSSIVNGLVEPFWTADPACAFVLWCPKVSSLRLDLLVLTLYLMVSRHRSRILDSDSPWSLSSRSSSFFSSSGRRHSQTCQQEHSRFTDTSLHQGRKYFFLPFLWHRWPFSPRLLKWSPWTAGWSCLMTAHWELGRSEERHLPWLRSISLNWSQDFGLDSSLKERFKKISELWRWLCKLD